MAERLGRTVEELLDSISSVELTRWKVIWKIRAEEAEQARKGRK